MTAQSSTEAGPLVEFRGRVECRLGAAPLGLRLSGRAGARGDVVHVDFRGPPPGEWPTSLDDVRIESAEPGAYRVVGAGQALVVHAAGVHVHRDVEAAFRAVVPQREAPLSKRLFWRVVLALAASERGRRLLLALRGRR